MSSGESSAAHAISYQYNKLGTVRAPVNGDVEVLLDMKLMPEMNATPDFLASAGGPAAEARSAGLVLDYMSAAELGIEVFNEFSSQWRPVSSNGTFAVIAKLPM
jgi:hypothetical protein